MILSLRFNVLDAGRRVRLQLCHPNIGFGLFYADPNPASPEIERQIQNKSYSLYWQLKN